MLGTHNKKGNPLGDYTAPVGGDMLGAVRQLRTEETMPKIWLQSIV